MMSSTIINIGIAILLGFFILFILGYAIRNKRKDEDLLDPIFRLFKALAILAAYIAGFIYLIYGAWVTFSEFESLRYESVVSITWFGLLTLAATALFTRSYISGGFAQEINRLKKLADSQEERIKALEKKIDRKKSEKNEN